MSLVFWRQEWLMGDDPVQVKFEYEEVDPCENSRAVHISPNNYGTVIDSEKRSIKANRKSTMGFPTSHQLRSCVTPNFLKMGSGINNCSFSQQFWPKPLKVCYKVSVSKNFQQQYYSAINYLSNGIKILAEDNLVPIKFGPDRFPIRKMCVWRTSRRVVQLALADFFVLRLYAAI